jgi:hypothetical protein
MKQELRGEITVLKGDESRPHQEKPLLRIVHILLPFVDNFGMAPIAGKC